MYALPQGQAFVVLKYTLLVRWLEKNKTYSPTGGLMLIYNGRILSLNR